MENAMTNEDERVHDGQPLTKGEEALTGSERDEVSCSQMASLASNVATSGSNHPLTWKSAEHQRLGTFALLLLDEFLTAHGLTAAVNALKTELKALRSPLFTDAAQSQTLWCELHHSCRTILSKDGQSKHNGMSTLEKLIDYCVNSTNGNQSIRKPLLAMDFVVNSQSPVTVCVSPMKTPLNNKKQLSFRDAYRQMHSPVTRPSRRPSTETAPLSQVEKAAPAVVELLGEDALPSEPPSTLTVHTIETTSSQKRKKKRKHKSHAHHQSASSIDRFHSNGHFGGTHASAVVHTAVDQRLHALSGPVEPVMMHSFSAQAKRESVAVRMLERELRQVRLEKITVDPKRKWSKKLGYSTLTPTEELVEAAKKDPYMHELMLERYGSSKRMECALCQFPFLHYNLPHRVSFKCIMDVYQKWQYEPPDRAMAAKYKPPLCYDAVYVCRMCAQIVFQHTSQPTIMVDQLTKSKSLSALPSGAAGLGDEDNDGFCTDPYVLPPLFGDDCYDHEMHGRRGDGGYDGDHARPTVDTSVLKTMIYANNNSIKSSQFMTSKEWEIINPERSSIRQVLEDSVGKCGPIPHHPNSITHLLNQ